MSSNGSTSAAAAAAMRGGGRVLLACDSCRQRKSRCDGLRPRCSHCVQSGRTCLYRPTPTNLDADSSVLTRLADTEARLQALEEKNRLLLAAFPAMSSPTNAMAAPAPAPVATAVGGSPQSMELFHHQQQQHHLLNQQHQQYQQQQQSLHNLQSQGLTQNQTQTHADASTPHEKTRTPPDLHTAAAFKLLTCWPRLTINMTIPQLETQTYLTRCDKADPLLVVPGGDGGDEGIRPDDTLAPWQASLALEQLYAPNVLQNLPVGMVALLDAVPILGRDHVVSSFAEAVNSSSTSNNNGSTSVPVSSVSDPMDADMDVVDEMTVAAATQLQQFHGGSTHNTNGDSMYDRQHRPHQQNGHHQLQQQHRRLGQQPAIDYDRMSFAQLLMLSIGIRTSMGCRGMETHRQRTPFDPPSRQSLMALSARTCSLALQKLWMLQAGPTEELVPLVLLLAHSLADFWVRPFHARGLLQSIDPAIKHMAMMQADDPYALPFPRVILPPDLLLTE